MNTLFDTREAAEAALKSALDSGKMHGGIVYQDHLSAREKGLTRFVAEGYHNNHVWKL